MGSYIMRIILFLILISCTNASGIKEDRKDSIKNIAVGNADSVPAVIDSFEFYPLKQDLYINLKGELAYRAFDQTVPGEVRNTFIKTMYNFDTVPGPIELKFVIDTGSFRRLEDLYYKDKKHIYYHFPMMDGGFFNIIKEAEHGTFRVLGESWYAVDKAHVYSRGDILKGADRTSFTILPLISDGDTVRWLGKDKRNMYDSHDILDKETIKDWKLQEHKK